MAAPLPNPYSAKRLKCAVAKAGSGAEAIPAKIVSQRVPKASRNGRSGCKRVGEKGVMADIEVRRETGGWRLATREERKIFFTSLKPQASSLKLLWLH